MGGRIVNQGRNQDNDGSKAGESNASKGWNLKRVTLSISNLTSLSYQFVRDLNVMSHKN